MEVDNGSEIKIVEVEDRELKVRLLSRKLWILANSFWSGFFASEAKILILQYTFWKLIGLFLSMLEQ